MSQHLTMTELRPLFPQGLLRQDHVNGHADSARQNSLEDYPFAHCDGMYCEHSFGSIGESAAHPPERLGERIHGD